VWGLPSRDRRQQGCCRRATGTYSQRVPAWQAPEPPVPWHPADSIVAVANAGGAFSRFGDITTLVVWREGLVDFNDFFLLLMPSLVNFVVPAAFVHFAIPAGRRLLLDPAPDTGAIVRLVDGIQPGGVSRQLLGICLDDAQRRPVRGQASYGLRLLPVQIAAAVQ
jgi:hypothetical protein